MAGFGSVREWAEAYDEGRHHVQSFRKAVSSAATNAGDIIDYAYFPGSPPVNFYASSPLEAAAVDLRYGIRIPSGEQFVSRLTVASNASSATNTTNQNQNLWLCDYLMYYPFIDSDAIGEQQDMVPSVSLPVRAGTGAGVKVIGISQSACATAGTFTFSYTNQDGVAGRTSQITNTKTCAGGGVLLPYQDTLTASSSVFIGLQQGDTGVRSIESITFTAAGGGLLCLILVKPITMIISGEECRRSTTGTIESWGQGSQIESVVHQMPPKVLDGAVLGFIGQGNNGSLASSILSGVLETQWGE
jgi:hypothetical protein